MKMITKQIMKNNCYDTLFQLMLSNKLDFVAEVFSHWHAIGVDAYIYELYQIHGLKPSGIIIIRKHPKSEFIISEKDFCCMEYSDVTFLYEDINESKWDIKMFFKSLFQYSVKSKFNTTNKQPIYLISPLRPSLDLLKRILINNTNTTKYKPTFVLIDEGIGTYLSKKTWNLIINKDCIEIQPTSAFLELKRKLANIINKIEIYYYKDVPLKKRFLFEESEPLRVVDNVLDHYKHVLKFRKQDLDVDTKKQRVVLVTEAFAEHDQLSLEKELEINEKLINFFNSKNFIVYLKPHPRESSGKYDKISGNFIMLRQDVPVEDFLCTINPTYVIGYLSTSLITAKTFYDLNSVSLIDIMLRFSDETTNSQAIEYKNLTKNMINFVKSFNELVEFI